MVIPSVFPVFYVSVYFLFFFLYEVREYKKSKREIKLTGKYVKERKGLIIKPVDLLAVENIERELFLNAVDSISILFSLIIKSDGSISDQEKRLACDYFFENYGLVKYIDNGDDPYRIERMEQILDLELESNHRGNYRKCCLDVVRAKFTYQARYDMLSVFFEVAFVHEGIVYTEVQLLRNIARFLLIKNSDLLVLEEKYGVTKKEERRNSQTDYLYNLYVHTLSQSYRTLELEPSATKEDVKRAYRRLAMKYHPDKQPEDATEEERARSASQFRLVNEAYNYLRKERKIV